jgi:hypothetical protein
MVGAILGWLLVIASLSLLGDKIGRGFPWAIGIALVGLVATLAWLGTRAQKVVCPECGTSYTRARIGGQCPSCGLRIMQADP